MNAENTTDSNNNNVFNELRDIRKEKGLKINEIAGQLKLSANIINKIEENDLKSLGAYTYVRGYIIHYSKFLGVNPDKFIALIPKSEIESPLVNTTSSNTKGIKFRRKSKSMASYALGTFIFLTVSFSGWYLFKNYTNMAKNRYIELVENKSLEILPQQLPLNVSNQDNLGSESSEESFHYSSLIPSLENDQENTKVNESKIENNTIEIPAQNKSQVPVQENSESNSSTYQITVETTETSWVKIEHIIDKKKLHNDLLNPGMISLESDKPIHFRIGNAENVKISINGEFIDLSLYSRKNIVDFNWPIDG